MDRVGTESELAGNFFFAVASQEKLQRITEAGREAGGERGGEFRRRDLGQHQLASHGHFLPHQLAGVDGAMIGRFSGWHWCIQSNR
jgi:hypothetical protein